MKLCGRGEVSRRKMSKLISHADRGGSLWHLGISLLIIAVEVVHMSKIDTLTQEFGTLSKGEKEELIKKLLDQMEMLDVIELVEKIRSDKEVLELLKTIAPVFSDWDNDEDSVYDNL